MKFYGQIRKVDEEQRLVWGTASTETVDSQGEVVKVAAMKDAWDDYMKFANVREMHQPSAVGKVTDFEFTDTGIDICVKVVDDNAWNKVKEGVYKGFSIGGSKLPGGYDKLTKTITGLRLTEISLVDRPANPEALISVFKADDIQTEETMDPKNPAPVDALADLLKSGAITSEQLVVLANADIAKRNQPAPEPIVAPVAVVPAAVVPAVVKTGVPALDTRTPSEILKGMVDAANGVVPAVAPVVVPAPAEPVVVTKSTGDLFDEAKGAMVQKGMYAVADLASMLMCIANMVQCQTAEAATEGDNSMVPAKLKDWLAAGAGLFVEMATEESQELVDGAGKEPTAFFYSAVNTDLSKVAKSAPVETGAPVTKVDGDLSISKADFEILKGMGATMEKMAGEMANVRKSADAANERADKLEKAFGEMPVLKDVTLRAVAKGDDVAGGTTTTTPEIAPVLKDDGTVDVAATEMKKVHAGGGRVVFGGGITAHRA